MIPRQPRRPVFASLLVAATVSAVVMPPTHIHLAAEDHDHHHAAAVEHAHWAGHFQTQQAIDDNDHDGGVLFIDHPARVSASHSHVTRPPATIITLLTLPIAPAVTVKRQRASGNAPRDGPPRGLSLLRAPPISPAL